MLVVPLIMAMVVFLGFIYWTSRDEGKGALQVTSIPKSNVFLNGKLIGVTPLEGKDLLSSGEYNLRLVPLEGDFLPFEEKIKITKGVLTVVDRTFGQGATSEGSIINLDLIDNKGVEVLIISFPDQAQVFIDSQELGLTPLFLKNLTPSDHEIKIIKNGYKEKNLKIKATPGYKLTVSAFLGVSLEVFISPSPTSSPSAILSPTKIPLKALILQTPTGFLNVRESGSLNAAIIEKVNPGESFEIVSEKDNWFEIKLKDGKTGWINNQYAQKQDL